MSDAATMPAEVWNALSDELRAFLRPRVPCESDADDVLQDVFVRIVEKIGSLREAGRVESWVYQIARNAIADFYRRRTPQPADPVEVAVDPNVEEGNGNLNRSVAAWLSLMIGALPETLRDAVRMYELEGLSQSEIANRLNISLSGAKSRVQRGRRQLEQLLRGSCDLETDSRGNVIGCKAANPTGCEQVSCECDDKGQ
jgi:RNA polymerase sigma-70 factor, ECF subfamily